MAERSAMARRGSRDDLRCSLVMSVDRGTKRPLPDIVDLSGDGDGGGAPLCLLWQCPECTLENESYAAACEVCATPRPDDSGGGGGGGGSSSSASDGWTCTACTFANGDANASCGMCGTDKITEQLGFESSASGSPASAASPLPARDPAPPGSSAKRLRRDRIEQSRRAAEVKRSCRETGTVTREDVATFIEHGASDTCHCLEHGGCYTKTCDIRCPNWRDNHDGKCYSGRIINAELYENVVRMLMERVHRLYGSPRTGFPELPTSETWRLQEFNSAVSAGSTSSSSSSSSSSTPSSSASSNSSTSTITSSSSSSSSNTSTSPSSIPSSSASASTTPSSLMQDDHSSAPGNALCWSYHPHVRAVGKRTDKGPKRQTPGSFFADDVRLERLIRRLLSRVGCVNDRALAEECFFQTGSWIMNFQPRVAAELYRRYGHRPAAAPGQGVRVWDPCGGWCGRLLGAFLSGVVSEYTCCEPSTLTHRGLREMADDLGRWQRGGSGGGHPVDCRVLLDGAEVVSPNEIGVVDVVLTSPPYFDLERYCEERTQSVRKFPTLAKWLHGFMRPMFETAFASLRPGGVCLINITNTPSIEELKDLEEKVREIALRAGFVLEVVLDMEKPGAGTGAVVALQPPNRPVAVGGRAPEKIYVYRRPSEERDAREAKERDVEHDASAAED